MNVATSARATPDRPLVSIVLACYNSEKYLAQTVQSVLDQTYPHWELVAVDDCSSDRTAQMLHGFSQQDARVRVFSRSYRGGSPAFTKNTGLRHVRGRFIAFIDHDDLYLPRRLEASVDCLLAHPEAVALFHDLHFVDSEGRVRERYLPQLLSDAVYFLTETQPGQYLSSERFYAFQMMWYAGFHTITTMIARDRLPPDFVLDYDTRYKVCDDTDLWIRLGFAGRVVYLDQALSHYRIHANSITSNGRVVANDIAALLEFNVAHRMTRLTCDERQRLRLRLANALADLGWSHRCAGDRRAATAAYARALRVAPGFVRLVQLLKCLLPVQVA
jgi:glycosyltransferase involved in cell wall biosynthesis